MNGDITLEARWHRRSASKAGTHLPTADECVGPCGLLCFESVYLPEGSHPSHY